MNAVAAVDDLDPLDRGVEAELDRVGYLAKNIAQHDIIDVCAEMAHRGVEQLELVLGADLLEIRPCGGIELGIFTAVRHVDVVHIAHQFECLVAPDIFVQGAAEVVRDVIFAVRKGSRPAEAAHDGTGLAFDAGGDVLAVDGTAALLERIAGLKDGDLQVGALRGEFIRREDAPRTCSDDDDVVFHMEFSF